MSLGGNNEISDPWWVKLIKNKEGMKLALPGFMLIKPHLICTAHAF